MLFNQNLAFWDRLFALPSRSFQNAEQVRFAFATGWKWYLLALFIVGALVWFGWLYRKDGSRPGWLLKAFMLILRMIAFTSLFFLLAQPIVKVRHSNTVRSKVIVLLDQSDSMTRPDPRLPAPRLLQEAKGTGIAAREVGKRTRLERMNALLNQSGITKELAQKYQVQAYSFASKPRNLALPTEPKQLVNYRFQVPTAEQGGDSTQIGEALRRVQEDLAGQPLAGMLILSDGGNNLGEDPLQASVAAKAIPAPVSTVGIGDPTKTKDIALLSVLADDVVRTNNTVTVYAALSQRGYTGKTSEVILQRGGTIIGRQTVRWTGEDRKQEIRFTYIPTVAGRFDYTVTVSSLPGEITLQNNRRIFSQNVISKKLKVLLVENEPRYEYRYLRNAILRDRSLDFACLLLTAPESDEGNIAVKQFPTDEKSLFEYDILILGDVPRSTFSEAQLEAMRRFVEDRGGSLLVIAGEQHVPHEYAGTPLEVVLPVSITAAPNPIITEEPFQWQRTPEGKSSTILEMEDNPATNEQIWGNLQGMYWAAGVQRAKPGATVLVQHPNRSNSFGQLPLVAFQAYGSGKCYVQLVDSTWRWRWRVGDRHFYRYWGQVFRTLTPKELPGNSRYVQLNADRTNYRLGEKVVLSARLLNRFYRPVKADRVTATVKAEGSSPKQVVLQAAPNAPGLFTADYLPERTGKIEFSLLSPTLPDAKATTAVMVESLALELQKPEMDETLLKRIAAAGGGKYYSPDTLSDWVKSLKDNALVVRSEEEVELWDSPVFLLLFLLPISLEWLLRKRNGLL